MANPITIPDIVAGSKDTAPRLRKPVLRAGRSVIRTLAAALLPIAVLMAVLQGPAEAATAWPSHSSSVWTASGWSNVRGCASTTCSTRFSLYNGSSVWMLCWTDSQWAYGNYGSNRWFYIWTGSGTGYIHSSLVYNQASSPRC